MSRFKRDGSLHWLVCACFSVGAIFCVNGGNWNEVFAQGDQFFYPSKGQSKEQQSKDKYECHEWAVQQTGYDPSAPPPPVTSPPPSQGAQQQTGPDGTLARGAARGAAVGAVGGAIAGNAGKGAAAGAAMGGTAGAFRKMDKRIQQEQQQQQQQQQQQEQQAQQQAALQQKRDQYNKAMKACMVGRGYTVE